MTPPGLPEGEEIGLRLKQTNLPRELKLCKALSEGDLKNIRVSFSKVKLCKVL